LDCGIDPEHPDLKNFDVETSSVNFYDNIQMPLLSHGTHCAGVAAAVNNDEGVVGVAPDAELISVKIAQATGSVKALLWGVNWCIENQIDVISISREYRPSKKIEDVFAAAYAAGIVVVASAGAVKEDVPDEETARLPAPACYPGVIAVSGINEDDEIAVFSARGPKVELCAPATNVESTILRGRYAKRNGTSMAAPHVAGAAAVVWSLFPGATNEQVRSILTDTARPLARGGRSPRFGYGCVDVGAAAAAAIALGQSSSVEELRAIDRRSARIVRTAGAPRARRRKKTAKRARR
jgi:subtilisin